MADAPETGTTETGTETDPPPKTQDNRLPDDHPAAVALKKANKEAEELRLKVKQFEDADKSELEKVAAKAAEAEQRAAEAEARALRLEVAAAKGLTPSQAKRLIGGTREELEADADEILADFAAAKKPADSLPSRPRPKKGGASDPDPGDLKGKERAAAAFRQFTRN
jgi:hypothetical protein